MLAAMIALATPLALHSVDRTGNLIPCGTGLHAVRDNARGEDILNQQQHAGSQTFQTTDYASQCDELISTRRSTAFPIGILGAISVTAALAARVRTWNSRPTEAPPIITTTEHRLPDPGTDDLGLSTP